jgi:tetratricopeptide (TPR) repeat protein
MNEQTNPDADPTGEITPSPDSSGYRRRRSGRSRGRRDAVAQRETSRPPGRSRNGSRRLTRQQRIERLMTLACFVLAIVLTGVLAFILGQRHAAKSEAVVAEVQVTIPSSDALSTLEAAQALLREGNPKRALIELQKLQTALPPVHGIDYLVGKAAYAAGEFSLARDSFQKSSSKKEMEEESALAIALLDAGSHGPASAGQMVDPAAIAQSAVDRYAASHPDDPKAHASYAEVLRGQGAFKSAGDAFHRAILRCDPALDPLLLGAKETLVTLQGNPPKEVPAMITVTSMDGNGALAAGYAALLNHRSEEAVLFLERASEFFPKRVFREILRDQAFDEFRTDSKFADFCAKF